MQLLIKIVSKVYISTATQALIQYSIDQPRQICTQLFVSTLNDMISKSFLFISLLYCSRKSLFRIQKNEKTFQLSIRRNLIILYSRNCFACIESFLLFASCNSHLQKQSSLFQIVNGTFSMPKCSSFYFQAFIGQK